MPVKIISDSTCDLSQDLLRKYDIEVAPLTVTLGNRSGPDGEEITAEDIYRYVDTTGQLPKTSAVNPMAYEALFRKWQERGFEIIHFVSAVNSPVPIKMHVLPRRKQEAFIL